MLRLILIVFVSLLMISQAQAQVDEEVAQRLIDKIVEHSGGKGSSVDRTGVVTNARDLRAAKQIRRVLYNRKITVNFDNLSFDEVINFLRDVTGLNIVVSKKARSLVDDQSPKVKLKLRDIRLRSLLILMFEGIDDELCFGVQHGVLMIGVKEEFKGRMVLRAYEVSDITKPRPDFPAPKLGLLDPKKP